MFSRLTADRRHDKLLRLYLVAMRERAEAQLAGASKSRAQRLAVRERALAGAVRSLRLRLGLPDTFDPELESARLGIDGKRPRSTATQAGASAESSEQGWRPRIRPVPLAVSTTRHAAPRTVTVREMLDFIAAREVDPDSEIVVRRLSGGHSNVEGGGVNAVGIGLADDGRIQLDIQ